jgi:hypothetical protein
MWRRLRGGLGAENFEQREDVIRSVRDEPHICLCGFKFWCVVSFAIVQVNSCNRSCMVLIEDVATIA